MTEAPIMASSRSAGETTCFFTHHTSSADTHESDPDDHITDPAECSSAKVTAPRPAKAGFMGCRGFWKGKDMSLSRTPLRLILH